MPADFLAHLLQQPQWVQIWVAWMAAVNTACLAFLRQREARVVLGAWVAALTLMSALFALNGFNRLLGLAHVVSWTPLLVYLWPRLRDLGSPRVFSKWLRVLVATNGLSLVMDYSDVVRYVLGDRG